MTSESTLDDRDLVLHEVDGIIYEMQNITKEAIATAVKNTEPNEQTGYSTVIKFYPRIIY